MLDELEIKILDQLLQDSRITKENLSQSVNLSVSACWRRLKSIEKQGFVSYNANVNFDLLGLKTYFLRVSFDSHKLANYGTFERILKELPEVIECHTLSGELDYIVKILAPNSDALRDLLVEIVEQCPFIGKYHSNAAISHVKDRVNHNISIDEIFKSYESRDAKSW